MYEIIIKNYVDKLSYDDVINYAKKNNIILKDGEGKIIYDFIKKNWREIYKGDRLKMLNEIKNKVSNDTYLYILDIYNKYKDVKL